MAEHHSHEPAATSAPSVACSAADRPESLISHRVGMSDVDALQINFTAHFHWMDRGFSDLLASLGHSISAILRDGFAPPTVNAECRYIRPVHLDDIVDIHTRISRVGRSSFTVEHDICQGGELIAKGLVTHVWVALTPEQQPRPAPDWLRAAAHSGPTQ